MNYKKIVIDNVELYLIKDKKFKTTKIKTLLINDFNKENFTKEKLLSNYLARSTNRFKDELSLTKRFIELYDPGVRIMDTYYKTHNKVFSLNMLNEKYTEKGMNKEILDLYFDFIFNPNFNGEDLDKENFELSKKSLEINYKSRDEDNKYKALNKAFALISEEVPIKYEVFGSLDELYKITSKDIYDLYNYELNNSVCKIFVIGDFDEDNMVEIISNKVKGKFIKKDYDFSCYILTDKANVTIKEESDNINQSILVYIYKFLNLTKNEIAYTLPIFNLILGSGTSKLYRNIREKESLAYSIYSSVSTSNNYLNICAGISKENYEKVKNSIDREVDNMINGKITDEELSAAKESFITRLHTSEDNQDTVLNNIKNYIIYGDEYDTLKMINEINKVTIKDLVNLGKKINLDVIYFLRGDK